MANQDTPTNTDQRPRGGARDQEQLVERHPRHEDPTRLDEERTSDNSTVDNGGIGHGKTDDPAMPADDSSLGIKI